MSSIKYIITDIEGTTTSISFVYDVLFPYFRNNISLINSLTDNENVKSIISETKAIVLEEKSVSISTEEAIQQLKQWSIEDRKIGPLKNLQGILWEIGYNNGEIKGHVYDDVPLKLEEWKKAGINLGIYSSGSIKAQKLLFGHSVFGDLNPYFGFNFDLNVGHKREVLSYQKIAKNLTAEPNTILFLSDVVKELDAAETAGIKTLQLVREGTIASNHHPAVNSFSEIVL
jgi:enolase-phosphatase E1